MYLVQVSPIKTQPYQEALSYFSSSRLAPGTLVKVPVRQSYVSGIVTRSRDVRGAKADIRKAGFALRKIRQGDILGAGVAPTIQNTRCRNGPALFR